MTLYLIFFVNNVSPTLIGALFVLPRLYQAMGGISSTMQTSYTDMTPQQRANQYFGDTENGKKHGEGSLFDENGDLVYEGE